MTIEYGMNAPALDARLYGKGMFTFTAGNVSTAEFLFEYDCKFNGIEIITDANVVFGDTLTLETRYATSTKRYKKFAKNWALTPNSKTRIILFPTEPKAGVTVSLKYTSIGAVDPRVMINLFTFVDQARINPAAGEEGEDW